MFPELWNIGCDPSPMDSGARQTWMNSAINQRSNFFHAFAAPAQELGMNIAITYLEAHQPKPRNTMSIINGHGDVVLSYSKVFICDFGKEELLKDNPSADDIGCDVNCSPVNRSASANSAVQRARSKLEP